MKRSAWTWVGVFAAAGLVGTAWGQEYNSGGSPMSPAYQSSPSSGYPTTPQVPSTNAPSAPTQAPEQMQPNTEAPPSPPVGAAEQPSTLAYQGNSTTAAAGLTAATTGGVSSSGTVAVSNFTQNALVLPGLLTSARTEWAIPTNRVFFDYGYFDHIRASKVDTTTGLQRNAGLNLNTFDVGVEKTLLDGRASVYARVPFLDATENTTGADLNGVGDVAAGFKLELLMDRESGSALTAGLTVDAPTAHTQTFVYAISTTNSAPFPLTTRVNPTFLQPWLAAVVNFDGLIVQEFFGVVIPTDNRVSTFLNQDLAVGYQIYRNNNGGLIRSITPTIDAQALIPVSHEGETTAPSAPAQPVPISSLQPRSFGFEDQLFITGGVQVGLGDRALLGAGVVTPVMGPKGFDVGFTVGLNLFF